MSVIDAKNREETHLLVDETSMGRAIRGTRLREKEDAWCRAHPEVLRQFEGQWVALDGEGVVAHGKNPLRLVEKARAKGVRIPYVFYVEEQRPDVVRLGL